MFKEVGYVDALIGRELDDGSVELIDGHLRQEMSGNQDVPVLILDVTEAESDLILASFDPITGMADTDKDLLKDLLQNIESDDDDVLTLIDTLETLSELNEPDDVIPVDISDSIETTYEVVIECMDEMEQESVFNRINEMGLKCRILTL